VVLVFDVGYKIGFWECIMKYAAVLFLTLLLCCTLWKVNYGPLASFSHVKHIKYVEIINNMESFATIEDHLRDSLHLNDYNVRFYKINNKEYAMDFFEIICYDRTNPNACGAEYLVILDASYHIIDIVKSKWMD
jgi:hypothetical protein